MAKKINQKEINFLAVLAGRRIRKKLDPRSLIMPLVLLLIVVGGVGLFSYLYFQTAELNDESNSIRAYLNSPETSRQLADAASIESQAQYMTVLAEGIEIPMHNLSTYPDLTSCNYTQILCYAGCNIELSMMSFDRATGVLTFTATSDFVLSIPTFISQLRNSGIFTDVSYSGYSSNVSSVGQLQQNTNRINGITSEAINASGTYVAPLYAFRVQCVVKPPDPPSPPEETEEVVNAQDAAAENVEAEAAEEGQNG